LAQPQSSQSGFFSELILGIFVLGLIIILIIELPTTFIDLFISINITIGVILICISLYVEKPLDLAAFPSIILIGTLFRLVLSIASTRVILTKAEAGKIIESFAEFVSGGNLIVGFVIFLIITLVQFMVITKGSERIAEVGARFALDAMPGKQMTIDADFNQGLISPEEAVQRREDLSRESALYGSLDGAMKFVKGDTIAGIIITVINIIGGLAIGMMQMQMELGDAVETFTKLTIGDGLAAQIPSLLMAFACGITMTRTTASNKSLARDIFAQFINKPNSLWFTMAFLLLIAATSGVTGLPWYWFLMISIIIGFTAFTVILQQDVQTQYSELESVKQNMQDLVNPNKMYERLGVDILSLQVGNNLLAIADPEQEGQLLAKIAALRQRMTDEFGYIIPSIRIMDSTAIGENEYLISIRNNDVATGEVHPGRLMIMAEQWDASDRSAPKDIITGIDPTYQQPVYWVKPEEVGEDSGLTTVDPENAIVSHLQECVRKYVEEIMTKTDVIKLMELVKTQDPTLINDLVPTIISTSDLRKIFVNLIREKISIKDIIFLFERLCDYARFSKEPDILSERLRASLGRQICLSNTNEANTLYVITLSQEWEKILDDSCQRTELGTMFLLNPLQVQELIEMAASILMKSHQTVGSQPAILCSPRIRLPLYQLLERHIPTVVVLSYSELITDIKVEQVDIIGEESY